MSLIDEIAYALLREAVGNDLLAADHLGKWQADPDHGQGFVEYLVRQEVFVPDASKAVELVRRGYLRISGRSLLATSDTAVLHAKASDHDAPPTLPEAESATRIVKKTEIAPPILVSAESPRPPGPIGVGSRLGRCTLVRELGEGGGGTVYEATHAGLGIRVAVKVLRSADTDTQGLARLRAEARMLAHLNHPNLVRVYDFDEDGPVPYLILELVEGLPLDNLIAQSGGLRPDKAVRVIADAARGLDAAAGIGIVHRDVKPGNILLDRAGTVKVADLGLAVSRVDRLTVATGATPADRAGGGGTVAYMAPERFSKRACVDVRSDIYSLGVTLFEAVTGRLPFDAPNAMELMVLHASEPVPDAHAVRPGVPPGLSRVIARMMAKDPSDRCDSYADLIADLNSVVGQSDADVAGSSPTSNGSWLVRRFWPPRSGGTAMDIERPQ